MDTIASGLKPTAFCDCATTENIQLTGYTSLSPLEVDGYTVLNGNRVLVKSQGATSNNENTKNVENGIYDYNLSAGELTRASDCDEGDDITNQYSFIENGDLNGLTAFIQTNDTITYFIDGTSEPEYTRFYAQKFQTGQGLELVSGTPTTLQVKSNLDDFLNSVELINDTGNNGYLTFRDTINNSSTKIQQSDKALTFKNNSNTTSNDDKSFKFLCNNLGDDTKQTLPLQFNSLSFLVDLSNNSGGLPVRYEAFNNSSGTLPIGHNFTGNCYIDGSGGTLNPHLTINQKYYYTTNRIEYFTNLDNSTDYNGITKAGDNAMITYKPLSIAHQGSGITSGIRIDISNVRLQASNANYYDLSLTTGHNFYGNCFFNGDLNNMKFSQGTINNDYRSVVIGHDAGVSFTGDGGNMLIGWKAGKNLTTGKQNLFIGINPGQKITDGYDNIMIGFDNYYESRNQPVDSHDNVVVGNVAGYFNNKYSNTFLGNYSSFNFEGFRNTFVGYKTANSGANYDTPINSTIYYGDNNTLIGANSYINGYGVNNSTAIGYGASVNTSNTIVLGTATETTKIPGNLTVTGNVDIKKAILYTDKTENTCDVVNSLGYMIRINSENKTTTSIDKTYFDLVEINSSFTYIVTGSYKYYFDGTNSQTINIYVSLVLANNSLIPSTDQFNNGLKVNTASDQFSFSISSVINLNKLNNVTINTTNKIKLLIDITGSTTYNGKVGHNDIIITRIA